MKGLFLVIKNASMVLLNIHYEYIKVVLLVGSDDMFGRVILLINSLKTIILCQYR